MADPNVKIVLTLDDKAAGGLSASAKNIERVGQAAGQASAGAERLADAIKRVGHYGAGLVGLTGLESIATGIVRAADGFTNLTSKLQLVSSSTSALNRNLEETFGIAQRTRQSWEGTAEIYGKLARVTSDLGISQKQLAGVVETVNQAILVSGGSAQSAQAALVQLGQGLASGTLRGEELNSVMEQTPRLAQALADGLGVGIGQLRAMGEAGELTGERVVGALQKAAASVSADFGKMAPTVAGAWQQISNAALQYVGAADKAVGASSGIANTMSGIAVNFTTFATAIEATAVALGVLTGGKILAAVAAKKQLAAASLQAAAAEQASAAAAVRSAEANTILIGSTTALTAAKQRMAAANAAVAASAPVGVIAALGGPIGAAVTAATALAGVLAVVAANAKSSGDALRNGVAADTEELVGSLQKQIDKIRERNRLLGMGIDAPDALAERSVATRSRNATLQAQIDALERQGISPDTRIAERNAASIAVMKAQIEENNRALDTAIAKQKELNAAQDQFGKGDPSKRLDAYFDKFGASARKAAADVANLDKATQQAFTDAQSLPADRRASAMAEIAANHTQRLAEIEKKAGAEAAAEAKRTAAEAAQVIKEQYDNRLKAIDAAMKHEQSLLKQSIQAGLTTEQEGVDQRYQMEVQALAKRAALVQQQIEVTGDESARTRLTGELEAIQSAAIAASDAWAEGRGKMAAASEQFLEAQGKESASLQEYVKRAKEELAAIGQSAAQKDELAAKAREAAAAEHELAAAAYERGRVYANDTSDQSAIAFYKQARDAALAQAQALRDIADLERQQGAKRIVVEQAKEAEKAWDNFSRDIEQALTDSLYRSFESGKNFGETFKDSLVNTFKSMILKVAVQALVSPVMGGIQGALGMGGQGGAQGAASGLNTGLNAISAGSNIYSLATGGGFFGGFSAGAASVASELALGASFVGPSATLAGGAVGAGATAAAATGSAAGAGALSSVGAALPYIGAAIAVASLLGGMFDDEAAPESYLLQYTKDTKNKNVAAGIAGDRSLQYSMLNPFGAFGFAFQHQEGDSAAMAQKYNEKYLKPIVELDKLIAAQLDDSEVANIIEEFDGTTRWDMGGDPNNFNGALNKRLDVITDAIGGWVNDLTETVKGDLQKNYTQVTAILSMRDMDGATAFAAELLDGATGAFKHAGETAADTFIRLVSSLEVVNQTFADLGYTLQDVSLIGAEFASDMVDAFGGLEQFQASTSQYFNLFYSDAEKQAAALANIGEAFGELDLALPATKEGFRAMVEAIDLTTTSGTELYAALLGLAPAFAQAADMTAQVSFAGVESALADVRKSISAEIDSIRAIADEKIKAIDGQIDSKQITLSANEDLLAESARLVESLSEGIDKLRNGARPETQTIAAGRAAIDTMLVASQAGIMPDADELEKALSAVLQDQAQNYATAADFQRAQLQQAGKLEALNKVAKTQKDAAQELVDLAKTQLDALEAQRTALEDAADAQIAALQDQATAAAAQLDALKGIDTGVKSLSAAMAGYATAVASAVSAKAAADAAAVASVATAQAAAQAAALQTAKDTVSGFSYLKGRDLSDQTIQALASAVSNANTSVAQIGTTNQAALVAAIVEKTGAAVADISKIGGAAIVSLAKEVGVKNVSYDVGTSYVPQDMTANIHKGEIIVDPQSSAILRRYGIGMNVGGDPALAAEVAAMRAELKAALGAVASNTRQSKELLDSVVNGGNTLRTEVIA